MKKVSLITIFDNTNFGTYLQILALGSVLKSKGFEVEVVNYIRSQLSWKGLIKGYFGRGIIKGLYNSIFNLLPVLSLRKKDHLFIKKYLSVSKKYTSFEDLKNNPPIADIYMTGSDQVWNSCYNQGIDRSYYLDFAPAGKPRVAYGASIGMNDFPESEKKETQELLGKYNHIFVREQQAKYILENLGLQNIEVVLDPTLLLSKNDWLKLVDISVFKKTEPYLLIYSVEGSDENELVRKTAIKIAKEKKMAIYWVSYGGKVNNKLRFADKCFNRATPPLFLSLFVQADFTVVCSFHGTAFSVNLNKEFISVSPTKFNSRIDSLLSLVNLKDRIITNANCDISNLKDCNYNVVNQILEVERKKSTEFIQNAIVNCNGESKS